MNLLRYSVLMKTFRSSISIEFLRNSQQTDFSKGLQSSMERSLQNFYLTGFPRIYGNGSPAASLKAVISPLRCFFCTSITYYTISQWTPYTPAAQIFQGKMLTSAGINLRLLMRHPSGMSHHGVKGTWFNSSCP